MKASGPKTHPVEDATVKLYTLFGALKTISCSAAHICLGQIRECPTPGYGHVYNGEFRLSRQNADTFSLKFTRLIRTLINADNGKALFSVPSHNYRFRQPRFTDTGYLRTVYDLNLPVKTEKVNNLECFVLCSVYLAEAKSKSVSISSKVMDSVVVFQDIA